LFDRKNYEKWKEAGAQDSKTRVRQKIEQILDEHQGRELPSTVKQRLSEISENAKKSQQVA
jgi:trimethylamine:corrinoid methyltransferase-like protein